MRERELCHSVCVGASVRERELCVCVCVCVRACVRACVGQSCHCVCGAACTRHSVCVCPSLYLCKRCELLRDGAPYIIYYYYKLTLFGAFLGQ